MADAGYDRVTGRTGLLIAGFAVMITAPLATITFVSALLAPETYRTSLSESREA